MFIGVLRLCRNERFFSNIVGDDVLGVPKRMKFDFTYGYAKILVS